MGFFQKLSEKTEKARRLVSTSVIDAQPFLKQADRTLGAVSKLGYADPFNEYDSVGRPVVKAKKVKTKNPQNVFDDPYSEDVFFGGLR